MGAAMPPSSHGRPTGEGGVTRTRWRAATAGRAAVAARAPSEEGGGGMIIAVDVAAVALPRAGCRAGRAGVALSEMSGR